MITIPFIYFSLLSLFCYHKHRQIDLATIISLMFAVSGFFSILVDVNNLRYDDTYSYEISLSSAIIYCFLLTICILPISKCFAVGHLQLKPIRNVSFLKFLSFIVLFWFISTTYLARNDIMRVLLGDMADIRSDLYAGISTNTWMFSLPAPIRFIYACLNFIFGCPWTLIFLGFYSLISPNIKRYHSYIFFLASLSGPFNGIIGADRSQVAYWMISMFLLFWLFKSCIPSQIKKKLSFYGLLILGALVLYLVAMTVSRFEGRDDTGGSLGSFYSYLGQPYINFCYFFDEYELPFKHWGILFPFTSQYIFGVKAGGTIIQQQMTLLSGKSTGVFYTFIGHIMIALGQTLSIVLTLLYSFISLILLRNLQFRRIIDVDHLYIIFSIISVVALGLFAYYYAGVGNALGLSLIHI